MRWMPLAAVLALLLTGCAAERTAPAGGLSDEELGRYQSSVADRMWHFTGLDDSLRPEVSFVTVDLKDWVVAMDSCWKNFDVEDPKEQPELAVKLYACRAHQQQSAEALGLLNTAQLDYLYDYYQDRLIPCMRSRGLDIDDVMTREEATDVGRFASYPWNPYSGIRDFVREDPADVDTWRSCPAFPPDKIFEQYWQRFDPYWRG